MSGVIEVQGLCKIFRDKLAVDKLSMSIPAGSICALLGENGAGKSTTMRMLMGLLPADAGRATILGQDCWKAATALRHKVGYVPERPKYYDWMTVHEIGWFTAGFHLDGFLARYDQLAETFQLDPRAKLQNLSKGQYAKVGLALALSSSPEVLLLDEPTSGLDLMVRREFLASMVDLAGEGRTILISSHQVAEVERVASHVVFLEKGRLRLAATMDELRQRMIRVRLRFEGQAPDAARFGTVLERNGAGTQWQAVLLDPKRPDLDDLRGSDGIYDVEETPLGLEDAYYALFGRKEEQK